MLNAAKLAAGLGISCQTVAPIPDVMVDLMLVLRLQPWASNVGKRLVCSPKVHLRDSGLLHTLLGMRDQETMFRPSDGWVKLRENGHRKPFEH